MPLRSVAKPITSPRKPGTVKPAIPAKPRGDSALPNAKKAYDPKLPDVPEAKEKAMSVRLSATHKRYLDQIMETLDCDRSEAVRRAIRLLRLGLDGHNSMLTVKDRQDEVISSVPVMSNGIPI